MLKGDSQSVSVQNYIAQKKPDIKAEKRGEVVFLEVKRSEYMDATVSFEKFCDQLMSKLSEISQSAQKKISLTLSSTLINLFGTREMDGPITTKFVDVILGIVRQSCGQNRAIDVPLPDVGRARIEPGDGHHHISLTVDHSPPEVGLRRLIRRAFSEAALQLPQHKPGIIVILCHEALKQALTQMTFEAMFEAQPEKFSHIGAVIFHGLGFLGGRMFDSFVVRNPKAVVSALSLKSFQILTKGIEHRRHIARKRVPFRFPFGP